MTKDEALMSLIRASKDIVLGRSINNDRKPDQKIEGPLWDIFEKALRDAQDAAERIGS